MRSPHSDGGHAGGRLNSRQWDEEMALLSRDYRVVRYDQRGSGRSAMGYSVFAHDDDLDALLTHPQVDRAQLIGVSAGAQTAIAFVLSHPEPVTSLMLGSSPVSEFDTGPELSADMQSVAAAAVADDLALEHQRIRDFAPFRVASGGPKVRAWLGEMILHQHTWASNRPNAPKSASGKGPWAFTRSAVLAATLLIRARARLS